MAYRGRRSRRSQPRCAPGAALLAVLQTGPAAAVLEDAVTDCGGRLVAAGPVDGRTLAQYGAQLRAAVREPEG